MFFVVFYCHWFCWVSAGRVSFPSWCFDWVQRAQVWVCSWLALLPSGLEISACTLSLEDLCRPWTLVVGGRRGQSPRIPSGISFIRFCRIGYGQCATLLGSWVTRYSCELVEFWSWFCVSLFSSPPFCPVHAALQLRPQWSCHSLLTPATPLASQCPANRPVCPSAEFASPLEFWGFTPSRTRIWVRSGICLRQVCSTSLRFGSRWASKGLAFRRSLSFSTLLLLF